MKYNIEEDTTYKTYYAHGMQMNSKFWEFKEPIKFFVSYNETWGEWVGGSESCDTFFSCKRDRDIKYCINETLIRYYSDVVFDADLPENMLNKAYYFKHNFLYR